MKCGIAAVMKIIAVYGVAGLEIRAFAEAVVGQ